MRGHRLVADDIVDVTRRKQGVVYGAGSPIIKHHMEIRGLGIINIKDLFGIASVRDRKKIELVIELAARNHLLKLQGHHSARDFADRLNRAIAEGRMRATVGEEVE